MNVWGVTGTNGKTTTAWVLGEFLGGEQVCGHVTTVEVWTGKRRFSTGYTTPPLPVLEEILAEAGIAGMRHCTMEVSSHAIHQHRTGDTVFAGGAFTNLTEDHLDYHKTMDAYFEVKADFFRRLAESNPGAPAAICIDGEHGRRLADICRTLPLRLITCSTQGEADLYSRDIEVSTEGSSFTLVLRGMGGEWRVECPLAGRYNVQNVLTAAALAYGAGVDAAGIVETIPRLQPRWGRLERVPSASSATVFVDYAHTDDALSNVLSTVKGFTKGKVWAVFGAGGDRDRAKRPLMGAAAAANADCLVVTSDNPRTEDPDAIIREIVAGIPVGTNVVYEPDRAAAIRHALSKASSGDSVVICGKGHETTQEISGVKYPFDDREQVRSFSVKHGSALSRLVVLLTAVLTLGSSVVAELPVSAHGTFVQRRVLADVDVTLTSKGTFRFERDRFFEWRTREPVETVFYATPTNYSFTVAGRTTTNRIDVDVDSIAGLFEIKEMKEFVKAVKTEPATGFPRRVCVEFKNGDRLDIDLAEAR